MSMDKGKVSFAWLDSHVEWTGKRRKWFIFHHNAGLVYIGLYRLRIAFRYKN